VRVAATQTLEKLQPSALGTRAARCCRAREQRNQHPAEPIRTTRASCLCMVWSSTSMRSSKRQQAVGRLALRAA